MAELTREALRELLSTTEGGPCITITMPVVRTGNDSQENDTRLKNLIRTADTMLGEMGFNRPQIEERLAPLEAYRQLQIDNDAAAQSAVAYEGQGMAFFLCSDPASFRYFSVDMPLEDKVVVADRFFIKSLLPALNNEDQFYVLTISQRRVNLLKGSPREGLHEIEVPNLPEDFDSAMMLENDGTSTGQKSVGASGRPDAAGTQQGIGGMKTSFAGHGAGQEDNNKQYLQQYMHMISNAIEPILKNDTAPLVVCAVDYLHPLYKQANAYANLMDEGIYGNPTGFTQKELVDRAWAIIEPTRQTATESLKEMYGEYITKNLAANRPLDVLKAAYMGQVAALFVPADSELWGIYDFDQDRLEVHAEQRPGSADLLDLAASQVMLTGGEVHIVPRDQMPDNSPIAAVFRFAL